MQPLVELPQKLENSINFFGSETGLGLAQFKVKATNEIYLYLSIYVSTFSQIARISVAHPRHKLKHPVPKAKPLTTGGVETITPQEGPTKDTGTAAGWNGSYVGVNAGMGFGAAAGTDVIVPFGIDATNE